MRGSNWVLIAALSANLAAEVALAQETAWVDGGKSLRLRSGPGMDQKIVGLVEPRERLTILTENEGWTRVQLPDGSEGWTASSELTTVPPPAVQAAALQLDLEDLRQRLGASEEETDRLREETERLTLHEAELKAHAADLEHELVRLEATQRWQERLAGATIAIVGALIGAIFARFSVRRRGSGLRLD